MVQESSGIMLNIAGYNINLFIIFILMFFVFLCGAFWKAHRSKSLDFRDMITRDGNKVSTTKVLQLLGGVVGTWVIVKVTVQGQINWDLYMIYLAYVAGVDGFSKLVTAKYSSGSNQDNSRGSSYQRSSYSYNSQDTEYEPPARTTRSRKSAPVVDDEEDSRPGGAKAE